MPTDIALDFKRQVMQLFFQDIHKLEANNYSFERYSYDGIDRSSLFDVNKHVQYLEWFETHYADVYRTYTRLADQASRDLLVNLLRFRLAGHLHVRIASAATRHAALALRFREKFVGVPSTVAVSGIFGSLVHYDEEWDGEHYVVDTMANALVNILPIRQYYFEREGVRIMPETGDVLIDGGCCTGDASVVFSRSVGPAGRVFAYDPLQAHIDICRANFGRPGFENITLLEAGIADRTVVAPPVRTDGYSPGWSVSGSGGSAVPLARIDDLLADGRTDRIDFIKMDVEGSELAALRGALASLQRFRPRLAISIYHRPNDYYEISDFIHDLGLGYRLYLEHYTIYDEETVLYAIAP